MSRWRDTHPRAGGRTRDEATSDVTAFTTRTSSRPHRRAAGMDSCLVSRREPAGRCGRRRRLGVTALYTIAIFTAALLLFVVQPMFARMVLPLLGGSPAVWNTAMVFYQASLLAGYAYACVA